MIGLQTPCGYNLTCLHQVFIRELQMQSEFRFEFGVCRAGCQDRSELKEQNRTDFSEAARGTRLQTEVLQVQSLVFAHTFNATRYISIRYNCELSRVQPI